MPIIENNNRKKEDVRLSLDGMNRKKIDIPIPVIIVLLVAVVIGVVIGIVLSNTGNKKVYGECFIEAGVSVTAEDFLKEGVTGVTFADSSSSIDTSVPGVYDVELTDGKHTYHSSLTVTDTIPPVAEGVNATVEIGTKADPMLLVKNIVDATLVIASFENEPDTSKDGSQDVEVILTDAGGNTTRVKSTIVVSSVKPLVAINVGEELPTASMFVQDGQKAQLLTDISNIDTTHVGNYPIVIKVNDREYNVNIKVEDTVPPEVTFKNVESFTNVKRRPEDFIVSASDISNLQYRFEKEPDITLAGEQNLKVIVTDEGGNEVSSEVLLTLKEDTDYPVITGVHNLSVITGGTVAYKQGVEVTDECMEDLELIVDNSSVNIQAAGDYTIIYTARDASGHETVETCILTVKERVYSQDEVNALADKVLARIITPGMSAYDKTKAIFNYVKSHVSYISHSEKGNYLRGAYEGLVDGKGDCFVYASVSKVLLTRAGIPNYDIAKIPAATQHYWNLVDIGTGWLHFDTTPRKDHPVIFLWDDPTMMQYSEAHNKSHNYDHSIYPVVSGSSEGTLLTGDNANAEALALYEAALKAQQEAQAQAAAQEQYEAALEAQKVAEAQAAQAAALAAYQAALNAQQGAQ